MSLLGQKPYTFDRAIRLALTALLIWGSISLLDYLSEALIPFVIAGGMAYLFNPWVLWFEEKTGKRWLAVMATLCVVLLGALSLLVLAVPQMVQEIDLLISILKEMANDSKLAKNASDRLPPDLWEWLRVNFFDARLKTWVGSEQGMSLLRGMAEKMSPGFISVLQGTASLVSALLGVLVVFLYFFFILMDFPMMTKGAVGLLPSSMKETVPLLFCEFDEALSRYFRAQALVAAMVGVLFGFGFFFVGLPLPWLMGLLLGLLNLVPYLQLLGLIPAAFLVLVGALDSGQGFVYLGLMTALVFAVVQAIQDIVLVPKVMGKVSGLSPAIILLALSVWGQLLGLLGLILAIPATCLALAWYRRWIHVHEETTSQFTKETQTK
jgi:predicted PurR-regulated permease PerM